MRPLFADPKMGFVFKKLFGSEEHKDLRLARDQMAASLAPTESALSSPARS